MPTTHMPILGEKFPRFKVETTQGQMILPENMTLLKNLILN